MQNQQETPKDLELAFLTALAKSNLRSGKWSLRRAAPFLGVHHMHLHYVLKGKRESAALLRRIISLPPRREAGFPAPEPTHSITLH